MSNLAKRVAVAAATVAASILSLAIAVPAPATALAPAQAVLPPYETWISDVTLVADEATAYLRERLAKSSETSEKPAVVFDVDNTTLETTYHSWVTGRPIPAISPMLALALRTKAAGAGIFFITGRTLDYGYVTWTNLLTVGYPIDDMYFYHPERPMPLDQYKTNARIDLERKGYTIVANIGNNTTDLSGGHAERSFKLPDYDGLLP